MTEYNNKSTEELYQVAITVTTQSLKLVEKKLAELKSLESLLVRELAQDRKHLKLIVSNDDNAKIKYP
ncbi:MAG: hypothetical protein Q8R37_01675 [Nanoarchaeota archaeon]|nr:hypothetical protein [Nanoarchaeota archaeon]